VLCSWRAVVVIIRVSSAGRAAISVVGPESLRIFHYPPASTVTEGAAKIISQLETLSNILTILILATMSCEV